MDQRSRNIDDINKPRTEDGQNRTQISLTKRQADQLRELLIKQKKKRRNRQKLLIISAICIPIILLVAVAGIWRLASNGNKPSHISENPVPAQIRQSVDFPIYFPDQKKLPDGYTLDTRSFSSPQKGVVVYSVNHDNGKHIIFALQAKPPDNVLQQFYSKYIPLHSKWDTALGPAIVGAHQQKDGDVQTVVSLIIDRNNNWIIATAPSNISQESFKQILNSLKKN